jgi:hypothetical protein
MFLFDEEVFDIDYLYEVSWFGKRHAGRVFLEIYQGVQKALQLNTAR